MDNQAEFLQRVVARMGPYIVDATIRRSRLDRVLRSVGPAGETMRSGVVAELSRAGVCIVDDVARPQAVPHQAWPPPAVIRVVDSAEVRAARRRLRADRTTRRPDRVLLTAEEEAGLALLVRAGGPGPLPPGAFGKLSGEPRAAAECLVLHNQLLVRSMARRYRPPGLSPNDLFQHGVIGLLRAVELFDPTLHFKFSTYATHWIRQAIGRAIANESRMIRLPVHMYDRVVKVWNERERLSVEGQPPSVWVLAHACELTIEQTLECLELGDQRVTSLDAPVGRGESTLGEVLPIEAAEPTPDASLNERLLKEAVRCVLTELRATERDIIIRRFGLGGGTEQTLQEIGDVHGVTRERIRQVEAKAIKKLQHEQRAARLRPHY